MNEMEKREQTPVATSSAEQLISPESAFSPDVSIRDNKEALIFSVDLPGVKKGDVSIEIDESNIVIVRAKSTFKPPEGNLVFREVTFGDFYRAFTLSNEFDKDKVNASFENGVLTLIVPRREDVKPKKIQISA
jgi:HSP20 family protein